MIKEGTLGKGYLSSISKLDPYGFPYKARPGLAMIPEVSIPVSIPPSINSYW